MKYYIQSNKTGKYLSNLFEDRHAKQFQEAKPIAGKCYYYETKQIALDVAAQLNGAIVAID